MINLTVSQSQNAKYSLFSIRPSDTINAKKLAATVAEVITVPSNAYKVLFSCSGNFFARHNAAATIPSGDVSDGTASALNPSAWTVAPGDTIGVISDAACTLTLEFYV